MATKRKEHDFNKSATNGLGYYPRPDSHAFHDPSTTENAPVTEAKIEVKNCHGGHVTPEELYIGGMN